MHQVVARYGNMRIGCTHHKEAILLGTLDSQRVEVGAIECLDTINQTLIVSLLLEGADIHIGATPARVIVNDECALCLGTAERLVAVGVVDGVVILGEDGVVVANGFGCARNLHTRHNGYAITLGGLLGKACGEIQIDLNATLLGAFVQQIGIHSLGALGQVTTQEVNHLLLIVAVLGVLGDSDSIQAIEPRLLHTILGCNVGIGEDGVGVQVGLIDVQPTHLRQDNLVAYLLVVRQGLARHLGVVVGREFDVLS